MNSGFHAGGGGNDPYQQFLQAVMQPQPRRDPVTNFMKQLFNPSRPGGEGARISGLGRYAPQVMSRQPYPQWLIPLLQQLLSNPGPNRSGAGRY